MCLAPNNYLALTIAMGPQEEEAASFELSTKKVGRAYTGREMRWRHPESMVIPTAGVRVIRA